LIVFRTNRSCYWHESQILLQCTLESSSTLAAPYLSLQAFPKEFTAGFKIHSCYGVKIEFLTLFQLIDVTGFLITCAGSVAFRRNCSSTGAGNGA